MWTRLLRRLFLAWCCTQGVSAVGVEDPGDWSQWRGPRRDGHAPIFGSIESWPRAAEVVWSAPVGEGQSSPVVAEDRVVVFERSEEEEQVRVLDLGTGAEVWREGEPVRFQPGLRGGRFGAGPKATPAVAAGRVVTFGVTARLTVRDLDTGELVWRRDPHDEDPDPVLFWGNSVSPLVVDGQVIVQFGTAGSGGLRSYDLEGGGELWRVEDFGSSYSSPIVLASPPPGSLAVLTGEGPVGVSMGGSVLWTIDFEQNFPFHNTPTLVYAEGTLVFGAGSRALHASRVAPTGGGWTVAPAWERDDRRLRLASAVIADGRVVGLGQSKKGQLFCLDLETGSDVWLGPPRAGEHVALLVVPGYLLALDDGGTLTVLERGAASYAPVVTYEVSDSPVYAYPAVIEGGLVIRSDERLQRLRFGARPCLGCRG